jgi:Type IV secretion system pilin
MITRILIFIFAIFLSIPLGYAADSFDDNPNIRGISVGWSSNGNDKLDEFVWGFWISDFFFTPDGSGGDGILGAFTVIAFNIKNIIMVLAVIFLIIAVIKLLFSPNDEENVKKWRSSIIWVTVGIFLMQIVFSVWSALILQDTSSGIDGSLGWVIWERILGPIVGILQLLASLGFLLMIIYAFYIIVGSAWDEEQLKKWKKTIIYGFVGFFLMQFPAEIIRYIYGGVDCEETAWFLRICRMENPDPSGLVELIGRVILYFNGFLMLVCVILIIYAGWLVLISGGDEEKLKKAKSTILYVLVGFVVLVASHAIFRFFILQ